MIDPIKGEPESSFRDAIPTVDEQGKRIWVYPRKPSGRFYRARNWVSIFLLLAFFTVPFIRVDGHPFFLFNVLEGKFILFGIIFWPQDFVILGIGMLAAAVFIALFTVVYGRVFCGWVCPQTIFMEMVFRKIEYWIEGDAPKQRALKRSKWNRTKIFKKAAKHGIFFLISFIISNLFLSYIIGTDELFRIMTGPLSEHTKGFVSMLIFTGVFYGVFAFVREIVCTHICPYGRLQGVLLDKDSIVVGYDYARGEPRGKLHKGRERNLGDCIDCLQCVQVCPTGIDIRNGTQLECIHCTACIDACDHMMDKAGLPRGLIRYTSENGLSGEKKFSLTGRALAYSLILLGLVLAMGFGLATRDEVDARLTRAGGQLYQSREKGRISNLYNLRLTNKTWKELADVRLEVENLPAEIEMVGMGVPVLPAEGIETAALFIVVEKGVLDKRKTTLKLNVYAGDQLITRTETTFFGPF